MPRAELSLAASGDIVVAHDYCIFAARAAAMAATTERAGEHFTVGENHGKVRDWARLFAAAERRAR